MSIAVSAVVRPSPRLRLLYGAMCGGVAASAACCPGWLWPAVCVLAAGAGVRGGWPLVAGMAKRRQIDISGPGHIRLTVYQQTGMADDTASLALQAGSTLWPGLLLLRLGSGGMWAAAPPARPQHLMILPDSVAPPAFRMLALACRALAARPEKKGRIP